MIACGKYHSLLIDPEGVVWASGSNICGQLGLGSFEDQHKFCQIQGVPSAVQVSAALDGYHSTILDYQGNVYMFGLNDISQSLRSSEEHRGIISPKKVANLPQIIMVSCGVAHSIALDTEGCLWGVGNNEYGQLSSKGVMLKKFTQITSNTTDPMGIVTKISCGSFHNICQSETGELWGAGKNCYGQLGVGNYQNVDSFQKVPLEDDITVQNLYCGMEFSVILARDGGVWATGYGGSGELGSDSYKNKNKLTKMKYIPPIVHIVCGGRSVIMTDRNGQVYACGDNSRAQVGVDHIVSVSHGALPYLPRIVQGCISLEFSLVADEEGCVWASGSNRDGQHGLNKIYAGTNGFICIEGTRAKAMNEKRFLNTKRAN